VQRLAHDGLLTNQIPTRAYDSSFIGRIMLETILLGVLLQRVGGDPKGVRGAVWFFNVFKGGRRRRRRSNRAERVQRRERLDTNRAKPLLPHALRRRTRLKLRRWQMRVNTCSSTTQIRHKASL
jgi:hypothetical protein